MNEQLKAEARYFLSPAGSHMLVHRDTYRAIIAALLSEIDLVAITELTQQRKELALKHVTELELAHFGVAAHLLGCNCLDCINQRNINSRNVP